MNAPAVVVHIDPLVGVLGATPCGRMQDSTDAVGVAWTIGTLAVMAVEVADKVGTLQSPISVNLIRSA